MDVAEHKIVWAKNRIDWLSCTVKAAACDDPSREAFATIERLAQRTNAKGWFSLWEGYQGAYGPGERERWRAPYRCSNEVRVSPFAGRFFSRLVQQRRPMAVVEFGTAFGVSGMYWLYGLESIGQGLLYTFEPNAAWRALAVENLHQIGGRFVSITGTFEDEAVRLPRPENGFDIAFVDAIHTSAFVYRQIEMLEKMMPAGGIIILDDINFSDDMRTCWSVLSRHDGVAASAEVDGRLGIIVFAN